MPQCSPVTIGDTAAIEQKRWKREEDEMKGRRPNERPAFSLWGRHLVKLTEFQSTLLKSIGKGVKFHGSRLSITECR